MATSLRLLCTLALLCLSPYALRPSDHVDKARSYVGQRETHGPNRSPVIDAWNRAVGAALGSPYCASAVSDWTRGTTHTVRSAASRRHITGKAIPAAKVLRGAYRVKRGDVIIWVRAGGGHIGIAADDWKGSSGPVIEANTSSGQSGSQWNGDGVWVRYRVVHQYSAFRITHVIPCTTVTKAS